MPLPKIVHSFFFNLTLIPSFLIACIAANTSSDINKFFEFEIPFASEENKTHLMLRLLSPLTYIVLLKLLIFFLIISKLDINYLIKFEAFTKICIFSICIFN